MKNENPALPLNADRVKSALAGHSTDFSVHVFDQLDSTNSYLMQLASRGARHATCIVAERQTAGRGRHGRYWISTPCGSLTFSLLWRFAKPIPFLEGLSLAAGVAIVRALRELGMNKVELKWPNDILHQYHKLAGVLIESGSEPHGMSYAVIGVGINIHLTDHARSDIGQAVTDWTEIMQFPIDRNTLLIHLLANLAEVFGQFGESGLSALRQEWNDYHAYQDTDVRLVSPDRSEFYGRVKGIADNGALLLVTSQGEKRYNVGEISLRAAQ
ncbi:MAG: biotin--[acetyl-CoA-carboxylase] ligase [Burkholderiales bacterium]